MKLLTNEQVNEEFLRLSRQRPEDFAEGMVGWYGCTWKIDGDSEGKTYLGNLIADIYKQETQTFLLVSDWNIWTESGNALLFDLLRRQADGYGALSEKPGVQFEKREGNYLSAFVTLILDFDWGGTICGTNGELVIQVDHDRWLACYFRSAELAVDMLMTFDLPRLKFEHAFRPNIY